jgi:O-methyltransferase
VSSILSSVRRRLRARLRGASGGARAPGALDTQTTPEDRAIVERVRPYTMTSAERVHALLDAVAYVTARDIPGAFVECGVWRGGSVMAMLLKLQALGVTDRDIYLYDTFEGMTEPTAEDTSSYDPPAALTWQQARESGKRAWSSLFGTERFSEQSVRETLIATGYPAGRLHFVKGPVEQTIPGITPAQIAILRLDTDWYVSTRHELIHLWPRLQQGGVMILDDYGHWDGCRKAVDEYFGVGASAPVQLLSRIDYTGRLAVKT